VHRDQAKLIKFVAAACDQCRDYHDGPFGELYDYWETDDQGLVLGARFLWWQDPNKTYAAGSGFDDTRKLLAFEVMYGELGMPCWDYGGAAYYTTAYDSADKEVKEYANTWVAVGNPKINLEHVNEADTRYQMFPFWKD
jgi:hypothetical protein